MDSGDVGAEASIGSYERSWEVFAVVLLLATVLILASHIFGAWGLPQSGWDRAPSVAVPTSYSA